MCDTMVSVSADGVMFAKNSDRDANEPQLIEWHAPRQASPGEKLKCTYIEIDSVRETHATLISRPIWMWGAEMGTNDCGVTIGNEAVFTKAPVPQSGLTGMDLLRLALERASSAMEAVDVIRGLIDRYGQGGAGSFNNSRFKYFSSFIVADAREAFVLETSAHDVAVEHVQNGVRTISNGLTITDFSKKHSDFLYTKVNACRIREKRSAQLSSKGQAALDYMSLLRDHGEGRTGPIYNLINGAMDSVCMHAGGLLAASQTTASWISQLSNNAFQHWVTGTAAPCTSLFKPVRVNEPLTTLFNEPFSALDYWLAHEEVHKIIVSSDATLSAQFVAERNQLERAWAANPPNAQKCFEQGALLDKELLKACQNQRLSDGRPWFVKRHWKSLKNMLERL